MWYSLRNAFVRCSDGQNPRFYWVFAVSTSSVSCSQFGCSLGVHALLNTFFHWVFIRCSRVFTPFFEHPTNYNTPPKVDIWIEPRPIIVDMQNSLNPFKWTRQLAQSEHRNGQWVFTPFWTPFFIRCSSGAHGCSCEKGVHPVNYSSCFCRIYCSRGAA